MKKYFKFLRTMAFANIIGMWAVTFYLLIAGCIASFSDTVAHVVFTEWYTFKLFLIPMTGLLFTGFLMVITAGICVIIEKDDEK